MVLDGRNRPQTRSPRRPLDRRRPLQVVSSNHRAARQSRPKASSPPRRARLRVVAENLAPAQSTEVSPRERRFPDRAPARRQTRPRPTPLNRKPQPSRTQRTASNRRLGRTISPHRHAVSPHRRRAGRSQTQRSPRWPINRPPSSQAQITQAKSTQAKSTQAKITQTKNAPNRRRRRTGLARRRPAGSRAAQWKQRQQRLQSRPAAPPVSPLIYVLRLLIVGIGLGVIAGTILAALDPSLRYEPVPAEAAALEAAKQPPSTELVLKRDMPALTTQLQALINQNEGLTAGVMVVDLDRESYAAINASRQFASASTIKLPILVALLEAVDGGNVGLDELLTMEFDDIVDEAGEMQFQPPGSQFSVLETATEMIRISDNTATNLLIKRLGGMSLLNDRFRAWGLKQTALRNRLPDLEGTNTISPKDLVTLLGRVNRGDILSPAGRDRLFQILQTTETSELLPQGIGSGATIAHKTGNIGKAIGDVGLVQMPSGKNYLMMAMVERPHGDERADQLIRDLSWETYQFLESTEQKSEQLVPTTVPRSNIAGEGLEIDSSIMTTD